MKPKTPEKTAKPPKQPRQDCRGRLKSQEIGENEENHRRQNSSEPEAARGWVSAVCPFRIFGNASISGLLFESALLGHAVAAADARLHLPPPDSILIVIHTHPNACTPAKMAATYKDAGVDLDVYAESMSRLPRLMHRTFSPRVIPSDGGFAGLFSLDFAGKLFARNYQDPVLVSGTDGVGTKLKIAQVTARHSTVGIDLVAMCVNDLLCTGAEPLFFLDYVAMGKDDPARLEQIVQGISDGCVLGDMALLGGETAIMPDMYGDEDYDLAGFAVGVVEKKRLISGKSISEGDIVLGMAASGLHSNGFSLVRKVINDAGLGWDDCPDTLGGISLADACLEPTRIYTKALRAVHSHYQVKQVLHGLAHITGGGFEENLDRILPAGVDAIIDPNSWDRPPIFRWLQETGNIADSEMRRVFNMGIGMALVVSDFYASSIASQISDLGIPCVPVGKIVRGTGKVQYSDDGA